MPPSARPHPNHDHPGSATGRAASTWRRPVRRLVTRLAVISAMAAGGLIDLACTAHAADPGPVVMAADSLDAVANNLRGILMGVLAALATLYATIGAVRYISAGGDPGEIERAKSAFRSAGIGYGLAFLAPLLVTLVKQVVG